jgi:hypothetical protein
MVHGIVREYAKKYSRVAIFSLPHNYLSVSFMFRDLPNVLVIKGDNAFAEKMIANNATAPASEKYDEVKIIGFDLLNRTSGVPLEKQFYTLAGLDISKKWENFHVDRDYAKEKEFYEKFAPKEPYVFLHEDTPRSFLINRKKINPAYKIFVPDASIAQNFFDYGMIIEKAAEIHVIDSSFMFLIDCLEYSNPTQKLFVHRYSRENPKWKLPILKKNWHIYNIENFGSGLYKYLKQELYEFAWVRKIASMVRK